MVAVHMNRLYVEHYVEQVLSLNPVPYGMLPQNPTTNNQRLSAPLKSRT